MRDRIEIVEGDITTLQVDAIVNAANSSLLGGGGVDGAIHLKAGPELLADCRKLSGCATGEALITAGHRLAARFVIHTVGPVWHGGAQGEPELLRNCYRNALRIAHEHLLASIAFPAIATGAYHFPMDLACRIALTEVKSALSSSPELTRVIFVAFSPKARLQYQESMEEIFP
jgi:O-acetyl-ADP-ribose deacetylase (regulator of RNase III)